MFLLMTPCAIRSTGRTESPFFLNEMEAKGVYSTLDEAIEAAIRADVDLEAAVIEKNGARHSVNGWIACRIAGGLCAAG
jgi:hypothetical protein